MTSTEVQIFERCNFSLIMIFKANLSFLLHTGMKLLVGTSWHFSFALTGRWLAHDFLSNSDACPHARNHFLLLTKMLRIYPVCFLNPFVFLDTILF